jgi:clan AA aspartic protease (TIGR02281 family)
MKISIGRQHSAFPGAHWPKFSRGLGLSRGSGLSAAVFLIAATITCSGLSAAGDMENTKGQKTEIPFDLYNGNLIIVKATVGSVENVNFIVDTGTSPSAISTEMADRLRVRGETETLQTLNGHIQAQIIILPHIQIGTLSADSIRVAVQDLSFMERSLGISLGGIAGLDILSTGSFTIDYRKRKIIFGAVASNAKQIRFETQVPLLTVTVKVEGQEVRLLLDSGTWGLLVYRNRFRTAQDLRFDPNAWISTAGGMTHVRWLRAGVSLGKENLGSRNIGIADIDPDPQNNFDGLLGFAKMGFRKVSFDFENGLFGWE